MTTNAEYVRQRRDERRAALFAMLGGQCVGCGATDGLEFDHVDPATKAFNIGTHLAGRWDRLVAEAAKCQLLCHPCHVKKSIAEGSTHAVDHGGGLSGKKNCRCPLCKPLKDRYNRSNGPRKVITHCKNGHEFTAENTYWRPTGGRQCKRCRADGNAARYRARSRS